MAAEEPVIAAAPMTVIPAPKAEVCANPTCGKPIEGQYIVVRAPHLQDKVPVCDAGCQEKYFESVALCCAYCSKKLVGGHLNLPVDGKEVSLCSEECCDRYQEKIRPVCVNCGKNVPANYITIKLPGSSGEPEPVCNDQCFTEYEKRGKSGGAPAAPAAPPPAAPAAPAPAAPAPAAPPADDRAAWQGAPPPADRVVVFGRDTCGACTSCKDALRKAGVGFEERSLDKDKTYEDVLFASGFAGGSFTLPIVTYKGRAYWEEKDDALVAAIKAAG